MNRRLVGKKVLITGASSGIGQATALLLAKEGADLCLVARRAKELSSVADQCRNVGGTSLEIVADITDERDVQRMAQKCFTAHERIDVLINNAGYGKYAPFISTPIVEWDRMWNVNVRGAVLVTQAIIPHMIAGRKGDIINISSTHGLQTSANASAYCATKFAVTGFSEALAKEVWKQGIRVSVVCPGGVLTPFLGISPEEKNPEYLNPEDVAQTVLNIITAPDRALIMKVVVVPRTRPFMVQEI